MTNEMVMFRFPESKKLRVVVGSVCFYTTARKIRYGIGDFSTCNAALQKALDSFEFSITVAKSRGAKKAITGMAGTWEGIPVQLNT